MKNAILLAAFLATAAQAQQTLVAQKAVLGSTLPSNTEVWLSMNNGLTSKQTKVGDTLDLVVARDIMIGDYIVIPRGAPAHGRISYRTGKGAFGKSAKIEFDLVDVAVNGRMIPLSGHYRIEGQGNTGATVGAVVAVGVFAAFVTGHSATAAQGSEWKAYTKEPVLVTMASNDPPPAPRGTIPAEDARYPGASAYPGAQWVITSSH